MALINKKITPEELAQRLVNSKKVMQKVDTDNYEKGNINEELLVNNEPIQVDEGEIPISQDPRRPGTPLKSMPSADPSRINQSKLPDNIKRAMLEHPIPQITLEDNLDMSIVNKAKKLMETEGIGSKPPSSKQSMQINSTDFEKKLAPIIENIIRKVMDEKLTQILSAQQLGTINENLVLKVGDSIFHGKITGVKNTKTKK